MAASGRRQISPPPNPTYLVLSVLLLATSPAAAQIASSKPTTGDDSPYNASVSPALAILVVAIVSTFFLIGFFSVYFRRCTGDRSAVVPSALVGITGVRSRNGVTQEGLDPALLDTFPPMVYSGEKKHKQGKEPLECAVCLCEFEEDDVLRLLPRCSHVFHRDCIDIWLATHVTCPVCRSNLAEVDPIAEADHVAIPVGEIADREAELSDLVRIGSQRREVAVTATRSRLGSVSRMPMNSRSTEDWAAAIAEGNGERFRLRIPEDVRRELLAADRLRRSASLAVFPSRGEGSSRRGYRDGASRGWRSLRLGRSGRWPFLGRSSSTVRGRAELVSDGSSTRGRNGDGSRKTEVGETSTVEHVVVKI
ncbi:hypothetical protein HPP92_002221 [Vanilla planifolia]|uniref:RING-type E3 ubiquitin transferase n=1 Tax=Vanilla planifolia TaxID=51239 RepID=A0A835VHT6_VANPL|nr:hypothetical protein HPP92_002221 [Vanilla planifolia]